jgi:hypothetical protein
MGSSCESLNINIRFVRPERAEDTSTQTAAMPAGAKLVVNNDNGSTRVTVDPSAAEASITIKRVALGSDQAEADALLAEIVVTVTAPTAENNVLQIDAPKPAGATGGTSDLDFTLVDDELSITGILGAKRVAIVELRIVIPPGHEVEVNNTNGAVRAVDLDAAGRLTSTNGSIRAIDAAAALTIATTNGGINVEGHRGSLDASTDNGSIDIEVRTLAADQHVDGHADNGRINLDLPSDIGAALTAETDNGFVSFREHDFDAATVAVRTFRHVVATLNAGGPTIDVRTDNGEIRIDGN